MFKIDKMNRQFMLFQSLCAVLIASSAYGVPLPDSITSQYAYCLEMKYFSNDARELNAQNHFPIDNLCMDLLKSTYFFLSSAEGGMSPFIMAPKSGLTIIFMDFCTIGMKMELEVDPQTQTHSAVTLLCQFHEPSHALHVYHDIYQNRTLIRENFTIALIQKLVLDAPAGRRIVRSPLLTLQAGLYTELYRNMHLVLTLKDEGSNGVARNPVLIFFANRCNISDVLVHNNVIMRFEGSSVLTVVLTFRDVLEATNFCNSLRPFVNPTIAIPIPPAVQQFLLETRVQ